MRNVELHDWDFLSDIIQAIKSRRVRYAWNVVRVRGGGSGEMRAGFWCRNLRK